MAGVATILSLLAATAGPAAPPDLAACAPVKQAEGWERERKGPLPVPAAFRALIKADVTRMAVATLSGGTRCLDVSFIEGVERMALSPDGRFLSFGWTGYEASGHLVVDRTGKGQAIDTGVAPTFSPSRGRLASVEITESGFGSLNAFAVWRVDPVGLREIGRVEDLPSMSDWRIDRWVGEDCVVLSALPLDAEQAGRAPRTRYAARAERAGWSVTKGSCPSA
jgi:hypothetical protein